MKVKRLLIAALGLMSLMVGCRDEVDDSDLYTFTGKTAYGFLVDSKDFTDFAYILSKVKLSEKSSSTISELLSARGNYTVFAPSNEAIGYYLDSLYNTKGYDITQIPDSTAEFIAKNSIIDNKEGNAYLGSPDKHRGRFFDYIEDSYLCTMNNQGLLALAQLILPSEILSNFEVVRVEEDSSLIRIYLDESVKAEYKENSEIASKGFCEAVTIRDFPIRDKGVDLIVRRRKWYDKQNNRYFSDSYDLKAEGTRYSKEFAAFLKGVYGDDSYDLPFA